MSVLDSPFAPHCAFWLLFVQKGVLNILTKIGQKCLFFLIIFNFFLIAEGHTKICRAFTIFGPLLTVLLVHQHWTIWFLKSICEWALIIWHSICILCMDVNPQSQYTSLLFGGHCSNSVVRLGGKSPVGVCKRVEA